MNTSVPIPEAGRRRPSWRLWWSLVVWRHGLWLPLCGVMLTLAGVLLWQAQAVDDEALRRARERIAIAQARPGPAPDRLDEAQRLQVFLHQLQPASHSTQQVRRLVELTQPELAWQQAQFQQSDDPSLGITQLQITVPVSGQYRPMRQALDRALLELPNLALDQVTFRRQQAGDSQLEARLRFSLWLTASPARQEKP
jgi:hypothetical protein